jgi:hypothetical protein
MNMGSSRDPSLWLKITPMGISSSMSAYEMGRLIWTMGALWMNPRSKELRKVL